MTAISNTAFVTGSLQRPPLVHAVLFSLLLHLLVVVVLHESSWHEPVAEPTSSPLRIDPMRIELQQPSQQVQAPPPPATVTESAAASKTARSAPATSAPATSSPAADSAASGNEQTAAANSAPEPNATMPELSLQQLRQQAIDAANSRPRKRFGQPDLGSLPANWTRDALPGKATAAPEYLPPLNYTGSTGSEQWREDNGQIRSETVLADGTVVCGRGMTLMPNSSFQTTVIMSSVCGKKTGSDTVNRNALSRHHPGNADSIRAAAEAAIDGSETGQPEPED